jgi:hypothetical protein
VPSIAETTGATAASLPSCPQWRAAGQNGSTLDRMGHHDADPAERRRYAGVVLLSVTVLMLLLVGAFALHALSKS